MIRKLAVVTLVLVLLPGALSEIDTSPYEDIASQISEKQIQLDAAIEANDLSQIVSLRDQIQNLRVQLVEPRLSFLQSYALTKPMYDESTYLIQQMELVFPADALAEVKSEYDSASASWLQAESLYGSQQYGDADSLMSESSSIFSEMPASLASTSSGLITALRQELERTVQITPSMVAMLDNARILLTSASEDYDRAATAISSETPSNSQISLSEGHEAASSAFSLITRAREGEDILGPMRWALIIGPIILIVALILYFRTQFNRSVISCSVSSLTAPSGKESELVREINVTNIEKSKVKMRVLDNPPRALLPKDFEVEPSKRALNNLLWEIEMNPGEKKIISYKLSVPRLDAGWKLRLSAATAAYDLDGVEKKLVGKPSEITIV